MVRPGCGRTDCPNNDELRAFAQGLLSRGDFERVAACVKDCSRCAAELAVLEHDPDRLVSSLRETSLPTDVAERDKVFDGTTLRSSVVVNQAKAPLQDALFDTKPMQKISEPVPITGSTLVVKLSSVENTSRTNYVVADAIRVERIGDISPNQVDQSPNSKKN